MDKATGTKPEENKHKRRGTVAQRSGFTTPRSRTAFKGLGVAKRYCRIKVIGDTFLQM